MGFTPQQVGAMSMWQFMACADGWAKANDPEAGKRANDDEMEAVRAMLDAAPDFML